MKMQANCLLAIGFMLSWPLAAQEADKQCEAISAMTGDYFARRMDGESKQQMQQNTPPEFMGTQFFRQIDLAINLAFSFDESMSEDQVETVVFDHCMQQHPDN